MQHLFYKLISFKFLNQFANSQAQLLIFKPPAYFYTCRNLQFKIIKNNT
jgi:hypothetical protein